MPGNEVDQSAVYSLTCVLSLMMHERDWSMIFVCVRLHVSCDKHLAGHSELHCKKGIDFITLEMYRRAKLLVLFF